LINSGTAETNYGFWYPGKENDGASGWAFEPQKFANPWIQKQQGRGPWYYDGEIDLGFGGATRMAATVITDDPIFGLVAYGGYLTKKGSLLHVIPKDGLRRRIYYRNGDRKLDIELNRDGFAGNKEVIIDPSGNSIRFVIENRTSGAHKVEMKTTGFKGTYDLTSGTANLGQIKLSDGSIIMLPLSASKSTTFTLKKQGE
jgi:hypothetical protein